MHLFAENARASAPGRSPGTAVPVLSAHHRLVSLIGIGLGDGDCGIRLAGLEAVARAVLASSPEWFGRPAATAAYVAAAGRLPTLVAVAATGEAVGFAALERHTPVAAELHVMGVVPTAHRAG